MSDLVFEARTASRQSVMDRLMGQSIDSPSLPKIDHSRITRYKDPIETFCDSLAFVGGQVHHIDKPSEVMEILSDIDVFRDASRIASLVPDYVEGNFDAATIDDPHHLDSLDWVIMPGEFGVAENGAAWIDGTKLPHRVMVFIAQYSAIVLRKDSIVHNMHEAYDRIGDPTAGFGIFVSGPSKTADIEQSLVLGAHGCRKLQVFLV